MFAALFFIAYFVGFAIKAAWDFTHPGREPHWMHNPWLNAPAGVFFLLILLNYWSEWRNHQQKKRDAARAKAMASSRGADLPEMKLSDWNRL